MYSLFWILVRKNKICWICIAFSAGSFFIRSGTRRWTSRPEVFCEKVVHKDFVNFTENACVRVLFLIKSQGATLLKEEALAQVFFFEFCEIFKCTVFLEHLQLLLLSFPLWPRASKCIEKAILVQVFSFNFFRIIIFAERPWVTASEYWSISLEALMSHLEDKI